MNGFVKLYTFATRLRCIIIILLGLLCRDRYLFLESTALTNGTDPTLRASTNKTREQTLICFRIIHVSIKPIGLGWPYVSVLRIMRPGR